MLILFHLILTSRSIRGFTAGSRNSRRVLTEWTPCCFLCRPSNGSGCDKCVSTAISTTVINGQQSLPAGPFQETPGWLWGFDVSSGGESTDQTPCYCYCNVTVGGRTLSSMYKSFALFLDKTIWLIFTFRPAHSWYFTVSETAQLPSSIIFSVHISCDTDCFCEPMESMLSPLPTFTISGDD